MRSLDRTSLKNEESSCKYSVPSSQLPRLEAVKVLQQNSIHPPPPPPTLRLPQNHLSYDLPDCAIYLTSYLLYSAESE